MTALRNATENGLCLELVGITQTRIPMTFIERSLRFWFSIFTQPYIYLSHCVPTKGREVQ